MNANIKRIQFMNSRSTNLVSCSRDELGMLQDLVVKRCGGRDAFDLHLSQCPTHRRDGLLRESAGGRSVCRSSNHSAAARCSHRTRANRTARRAPRVRTTASILPGLG